MLNSPPNLGPTIFGRGIDALLRSRTEFTALDTRVGPTRVWLEHQLVAGRARDESWTVPGYCEVCERNSDFVLDYLYTGGPTPNFRERLVCAGCGLNNRQRFMFAFARDRLSTRRGAATAYVYEQVTSFFSVASQRWPAAKVVGSEYLGPGHRSGEIVQGVLHQDALALSFEDEAFDLIVANDVYEHVPDDIGAFKEAARVLNKDGWLVFSIPFFMNSDETRQRARLENGALTHLETPVYHGNPIDPNGSLVFFDYSWDLLARIKSCGFRDAYAVAYYSPAYGYIGKGMQLLFVAEK